MSADSINANGKSCQSGSASSAAASPASAPVPTTSASSVYSDVSYYKDTYASTPKTSSSMTKTLKSWTKELVSDMGKPPTSKYDAAQVASSSSPASNGTSAAGAPYWNNDRPGKI